ncbi:hypothetical protein BU23DRAFT_598134 [Bimuria novae-zelandiae CBS 107.79]|uniref:Uncharacterized protein n=1 Tax=Bimuria novae-zelandiae CBS 107.79 TaxID=1447943 RepID=A0A6A5VCF4_9PLEO|nr:hypothetical protein BU23DRAFT_598134 [Bimuria novae-zelandiae CBS 107.79]
MYLITWLVSVLSFAASTLSLKMNLTPAQRNVTQGKEQEFKYLPKNRTPTNITFLDSLTNTTGHVIDGARNGTFNWTAPADLEARGGYFFVLRQTVNNATITVMSDSEFQILEKPKPEPSDKPEHKSGAVTLDTGFPKLVETVIVAGIAMVLGPLVL